MRGPLAVGFKAVGLGVAGPPLPPEAPNPGPTPVLVCEWTRPGRRKGPPSLSRPTIIRTCVDTGRGPEIVEEPPTACANGHPLKPPNVQVMHVPCARAPKSAATAATTCGTIDYLPPHARPDMEAAYRPR